MQKLPEAPLEGTKLKCWREHKETGCRRQKANENARPGKPLRLAFRGKMPEALLRASTRQRHSTVEGCSLKGCIDQLFPFAKPDPFPRLP